MSDKTITLTRGDIFTLTVMLSEINNLMPDELKRGERIEDESLTSLFEKTNGLIPNLASILDKMDASHLDQAIFTLTAKGEGQKNEQ